MFPSNGAFSPFPGYQTRPAYSSPPSIIMSDSLLLVILVYDPHNIQPWTVTVVVLMTVPATTTAAILSPPHTSDSHTHPSSTPQLSPYSRQPASSPGSAPPPAYPPP